MPVIATKQNEVMKIDLPRLLGSELKEVDKQNISNIFADAV